MYIPRIIKSAKKARKPSTPVSANILKKLLSTARLTDPYPLPKKTFL
ncbi:MAG: hypothetical protein ACD_37C00686G0003 [uncultured bacterium]|nr:MAG: hypothetical protein ACD_37C00686G0003 [uncultured bacterium]